MSRTRRRPVTGHTSGPGTSLSRRRGVRSARSRACRLDWSLSDARRACRPDLEACRPGLEACRARGGLVGPVRRLVGPVRGLSDGKRGRSEGATSTFCRDRDPKCGKRGRKPGPTRQKSVREGLSPVRQGEKSTRQAIARWRAVWGRRPLAAGGPGAGRRRAGDLRIDTAGRGRGAGRWGWEGGAGRWDRDAPRGGERPARARSFRSCPSTCRPAWRRPCLCSRGSA